MKKKRSLSFPSFAKVATTLLTGLLLLGSIWLAEGFYPSMVPAPLLSERASLSEQTVALYANQAHDDLKELYLSAIDRAQQSILLIVYSLNDKAVIHALGRKSLEGVRVEVICDATASPHVARKLAPEVKLIRRFAPGLMHQKILVVDEELVWLGSANMTGESLSMHANLILAIQSPQLAALIAKKAAGMGAHGVAASVAPQEFLIDEQRLFLSFFPDDRDGVKRLTQLIDSAQKTIRIAMFTWTRHDLAKAVVKAKERGVDVQVVIDKNAAKGAGKKVVDLLHSHGLPVRVNQGDALFHHKFLYIDGEILVNGSANWTCAAFTKNDDCFMILRGLTKAQREKMDHLWEAIKKESQSGGGVGLRGSDDI